MSGDRPDSHRSDAFSAVDCVTPFVAFWQSATDRPPERIATSWETAYHDQLPAAVQRSLQRHRFPDDLARAVPKMTTAIATLTVRRDAVNRAGRTAIRQFAKLLGCELAPFQLVTLVGAFAADGWMEWDDRRATLLIAVEALESIAQAEILLRHEVAHVIHFQLLANDDESWTVGDALFEEGLATALSGVGNDLSDGLLCAAGRTTTWQGEPVDDWLARCEAAWPAIRARLLADFASVDDEAYADLFLGGSDTSRFPSRAGYYAGLRLVGRLALETPWPALVRWDRDTARAKLRDVLRDE